MGSAVASRHMTDARHKRDVTGFEPDGLNVHWSAPVQVTKPLR
jgi:hypothetical protein